MKMAPNKIVWSTGDLEKTTLVNWKSNKNPPPPNFLLPIALLSHSCQKSPEGAQTGV